ncbi:MAG: glyoxalase [Nitrospirales bacterium]|nr:MAG: glyoxalase [Nitrospirales bacterium]
MKRLHIHIGVQKLDASIQFYSALFGAEPVKTKSDYAKWMLDNPSVNFAISTRVSQAGVDHLGIQVDTDDELSELRNRLSQADAAVFDEGEAVCCYARSEKTWVQDPTGLPWEAYRTMEDAELFSGGAVHSDSACCTPDTMGKPGCCEASTATTECCG